MDIPTLKFKEAAKVLPQSRLVKVNLKDCLDKALDFQKQNQELLTKFLELLDQGGQESTVWEDCANRGLEEDTGAVKLLFGFARRVKMVVAICHSLRVEDPGKVALNEHAAMHLLPSMASDKPLSDTLSELLAADEYLTEEAPATTTMEHVINPDAIFSELTTKDSIESKAETVGKQFKAIKTVVAALRRTMKDFNSTSKQLVKAKKRYEEQCKRTLDQSAGQMSGRPGMKGLEFQDDGHPIIRGWRTDGQRSFIQFIHLELQYVEMPRCFQIGKLSRCTVHVMSLPVPWGVVWGFIRIMSGKRECKTYKTNLSDVKDEKGDPVMFDMNVPFILRKGKAVLSSLTKDKDLSTLMDECVQDCKTTQAERNLKRISLLGLVPSC